jgi:hypothetical protein
MITGATTPRTEVSNASLMFTMMQRSTIRNWNIVIGRSSITDFAAVLTLPPATLCPRKNTRPAVQASGRGGY